MNDRKVRRFFSALCGIGMLCGTSLLQNPAHAQNANTTLLLHFENNLTGAQGQTPLQAVGASYTTGAIGRAAVFGTGNQVRYASANNINATVGTLEFWIKPS